SGCSPVHLRCQGAQREHHESQGEAQASRLPVGQAQRHQASRGHSGRRRHDRSVWSLTMAVKKRKPTSPGRRFQTVSDFAEITTDTPEKSLIAKKNSTGGRNTHGRVTSRHRGGGHKQRYRIIDFKRDKDGIPARVATIEYDPNRNARIALLNYA